MTFGSASGWGQEEDYRPGGSNCEPSIIEGLPKQSQSERVAFCRDAAEQHRLQLNDLIQQTRSAEAAEAVAVLTFQQTKISAWGIVLGMLTLASAIAAAFFAGKAAYETKRAADAAERSLENDIRPLLIFSDFVYTQDQLLFSFNITNVGKGPARISSIAANVRRTPRDSKLPPIEVNMPSALPRNPLIMPDTTVASEAGFGALLHLLRWNVEAELTVEYGGAIAGTGDKYRTSLQCRLVPQYIDEHGQTYISLGNPPAAYTSLSAGISIDRDGWVMT